jgi:uncharacterized protein
MASDGERNSLTEPAVIGYPNDKGVQIERVTYPNLSAQTEIAANLFKPAGFDSRRTYAAILVGHPFLGVKEQTAGLHAQKLAERGFVTMAFDASHYGDSSGEPRNVENPGIRVEDFSSGMDFLSNHPSVDKNRIGVLGICGGGGYAVSAAQIDHRMRAIATVSMYDLGRARRQGLGDNVSYELRMATLDEISQQRTKEFAGEPTRFYNGQVDLNPTPGEFDETNRIQAADLFDYYATPRGAHPNCTGQFTYTSLAAMMNFFPYVQIETISPRPLLMIVGGEAPSAYFSEDAYSKAAEPKELFVVPGASHADLYDQPEYLKQSVPRLNTFFGEHLNKS